ncbi:MAG: hypothetical protein EAX96_12295 [Candidatus Lokiarchaeota archaeon]|nr:hypothetical protein [Candidatus Lokiarchaeota archaeon]
MVEVVEAKDMVGHSKGDFKNKTLANMWIEYEDVAELMRAADAYGVEVIVKRKKDYVFAVAGTIYYAKE